MPATKIQAAERPVGDSVSNDYRITVPRYQRPSAWTTEEAGEMFDDLLGAATSNAPVGETDPYFLGSIVLVKAENDAHAEVVDGQRRLTTLTCLLSALRGHVPSAFAESLDKSRFQKGDPIKGTVDQPRLRLRDRDQDFFEKWIHSRAGIAKIRSLATAPLSDSQRNFARNATLFLDRLSSLDQDKRSEEHTSELQSH